MCLTIPNEWSPKNGLKIFGKYRTQIVSPECKSRTWRICEGFDIYGRVWLLFPECVLGLEGVASDEVGYIEGKRRPLAENAAWLSEIFKKFSTIFLDISCTKLDQTLDLPLEILVVIVVSRTLRKSTFPLNSVTLATLTMRLGVHLTKPQWA